MVWDWGRAITETLDAAIKAEREGDTAKGGKLRQEYERLLAEHPPRSFEADENRDSLEDFDRRLRALEEQVAKITRNETAGTLPPGASK